MAALNIDTTNIPIGTALDPIPSAWYVGMITASETKPNSKNTGGMLELELTVSDGPFAGRKVFDRLNLWNQSQAAQEIAYKTLSAISHAVNQIQVADSEQLHNKPLQFKVSMTPAEVGKDGVHYEAKNEVKGYKPLGEMQAAAAPPVAPAAAAAPPWGGTPAPAAAAVAAPAATTVAPPWAAPAAAQAAPAAAPAAPPWAGTPAPAAASAAATPPWAK